MTTPSRLFKISPNRVEVLQGSVYRVIRRSEVESVHLRGHVLSVGRKKGGDWALDMSKAPSNELKSLVELLQRQRDKNRKINKESCFADQASAVIKDFLGIS